MENGYLNYCFLSLKDTRMIIWIESARALLDMPRIVNAAMNLHRSAGFFKLDGAVFGSDDFCANIGSLLMFLFKTATTNRGSCPLYGF